MITRIQPAKYTSTTEVKKYQGSANKTCANSLLWSPANVTHPTQLPFECTWVGPLCIQVGILLVSIQLLQGKDVMMTNGPFSVGGQK